MLGIGSFLTNLGWFENKWKHIYSCYIYVQCQWLALQMILIEATDNLVRCLLLASFCIDPFFPRHSSFRTLAGSSFRAGALRGHSVVWEKNARLAQILNSDSASDVC